MKPGDVILYESAKCYHGRPIPLEGTEYANIFLHYKPLKWDKFTKEIQYLQSQNIMATPKSLEYI